MEVIWSTDALNSYTKTIEFILEKWTIEVAEELEKSVNDLISKLKLNQKLCAPSKIDKLLRKCVVSKQTSIIYEVRKKNIELLLFVDNRSNHKF